MYCWSCGKVVNDAVFCAHCGFNNKKSDLKETIPKSFNEYVRERSKSRVSAFPSKKKLDAREVKETTIFASLGELDDSGNIKQLKRSRLPVKVEVDWGAYQVKQAIFNKLERYNNVVKGREISSFRLTYKSGETVRYLPGTKIDFTIKEYKNDSGVGYSSIILFLVEYRDFSSDSETELPVVLK